MKKIQDELRKYADPKRAAVSNRYFKAEKGEYAEGDLFLGLTVPQSRIVAGMFADLPQKEILELLRSKIHEERLIALLILIHQYKRGDQRKKESIYQIYLTHTQHVNNWDLVDVSADKIVGEYLVEKSEDESLAYTQLVKLARSNSLWERRIAILSTFAFLRRNQDKMTYEIADILLHDNHDLIHKAVGWLLREAGKRVSEEKEEEFLRSRYQSMPRTMLRYAIERFPKEKREKYLKGEI